MAREHDDDLEIAAIPRGDDVSIASAIATGLERIATVLERGLKELNQGMQTGGDRPIHTTCNVDPKPRRRR